MVQFISNFTSKRRRIGLKDRAHSCSQSKNYAEKVGSRRICVTLFRKSKRLWWDSKQNEWLSRSSRSKGFYKKSGLIYFPKFTRKYLYRSLFLIKSLFDLFEHFRSATSFKMRLECRFYLQILRIIQEHPFCRTPLVDCFWLKQYLQAATEGIL